MKKRDRKQKRKEAKDAIAETDEPKTESFVDEGRLRKSVKPKKHVQKKIRKFEKKCKRSFPS